MGSDHVLTEVKQPHELHLLRWPGLDRDDVVHAVTTRSGGVSPAPWDTLNLSWARPDDPPHVLENRRRVCQALEIPLEGLVQAGQIHGVGVRAIGGEEAGRGAISQATLLPPSDALITDAPGVYLLACFADCVPLLFYDPVRRAVGVAHAGWRGTVADMAGATVRAFEEAYETRPADLRVVIGPSIGPCCYEVGPDVLAAARAALPGAERLLAPMGDGHARFDLWQANVDFLLRAGVTPEHIEVSGLCTMHHAATFFSHRATGGQTGRFAAIIGMRPAKETFEPPRRQERQG
jgi:YfiH family protein